MHAGYIRLLHACHELRYALRRIPRREQVLVFHNALLDCKSQVLPTRQTLPTATSLKIFLHETPQSGIKSSPWATTITTTDFGKHINIPSYLGGEGGVTGALAAFSLDVLISPADYSPNLPAYAGLPVLTVPMGFYSSNNSQSSMAADT